MNTFLAYSSNIEASISQLTVHYYCAIQDFAVNLSGWIGITTAIWLQTL